MTIEISFDMRAARIVRNARRLFGKPQANQTLFVAPFDSSAASAIGPGSRRLQFAEEVVTNRFMRP